MTGRSGRDSAGPPSEGAPARPRPTSLGRYELITQIGQGGMAEVQLALQRGPMGFEKLVVVKLVHEHLASQKDFVDMLLDEARVAALVKHPNVVDIYDLGEADGRYFIAMEYLEGEPLLSVLRAGREGKRLDVLSTARLVADTAEGLDAAHELRSLGGEVLELVHHDVSLGNVVVLYNGQVKLVDFGVAKATQTTAVGKNRVQGKFSYMAPEKLRGAAGDRRSDIWSLGCVMWESLTLKRLFKGGNDADTMRQVLESTVPTPSAINPDVPVELDAIVMKALARDPADRFSTAKEVSDAIEEVLRVQGYGGKNDIIARYMQATFAEHITARKKLLQEVASKGRPSSAVIEAAFDEPGIATGTPVADFSVRFRRSTSEISNAEEPSFTRRSERGSQGSGPGAPSARARAASATLTPGPRPPTASERISGSRAATSEGGEPGEPAASMSASGPIPVRVPQPLSTSWTADVPQAASGTSAARGKSGRRTVRIAVLAVALVVIAVVAIIMVTRGTRAAGTKVVPATPGTLAASRPDASTVPSTPALVAPAGPDAPPGVDAALPDAAPADAVQPDAAPPDAPAIDAPPASAAEVDTQAAMTALATGNAKAALERLQHGQALDPSYPPLWRGLGNVQETLGNRGAARSAYQRYLVLAPNSPDAAEIRARLNAL